MKQKLQIKIQSIVNYLLEKKKVFFYVLLFPVGVFWVSWFYDFYEHGEPNFDILLKAIQVIASAVSALMGLLVV